MNGILILPEDIISVVGGGWVGWLVSTVCCTPLSTDWWDYSYLITDIHQVTTVEQLPPSQLSQNYLYPLLSPLSEDPSVCVCVTALL